MKVAHFEDKPGRHEREERKAYIAAVLMANPEYLDSLAPKTLHLRGHQQSYIHNSSGLFVRLWKDICV